MLASCHAELSLWRLLVRVAPRALDGSDDDAVAWATAAAAAHLAADKRQMSRLKQAELKQAHAPAPAPASAAPAAATPAAAPPDAAIKAAIAAAEGYKGEERTLRLATLEALSALVALQPTACAGATGEQLARALAKWRDAPVLELPWRAERRPFVRFESAADGAALDAEAAALLGGPAGGWCAPCGGACDAALPAEVRAVAVVDGDRFCLDFGKLRGS